MLKSSEVKKQTPRERHGEAAILVEANIEQEQQQRQSGEVRERSAERAEEQRNDNGRYICGLACPLPFPRPAAAACPRAPAAVEGPEHAAFGHFTERCSPPKQC